MIVKNAGNPSEISPKLISFTEDIINKPTTINTGAVAATGMTISNGAKKRDAINKPAIVSAVKPVRPPSAMPAADSTATICGDVPTALPTIVPIAATFIQEL